MTWYELSPERLILEHRGVSKTGRAFKLLLRNGNLEWEGSVDAIPPGVQAEPLVIRIRYPQAFPAVSPGVEVISPRIEDALVGHEWHRLGDGEICYVKNSRWNIDTTADEVIGKVEDWYFNFLAKVHGLVAEMPHIGRARI